MKPLIFSLLFFFSSIVLADDNNKPQDPFQTIAKCFTCHSRSSGLLYQRFTNKSQEYIRNEIYHIINSDTTDTIMYKYLENLSKTEVKTIIQELYDYYNPQN